MGFGFAVTLTCTNYSMLGDGTNTFINRAAGGAVLFRENNSTQMVINPGGSVGIGTAAPAAKLDVTGPGVVRARVGSDSNAGLALALGGQGKWSVATVSPGYFQIFNDAIGQNALLIDPATNAITVNFLGSAGSTSLCRNASGQISTCSSSARYKQNISSWHSGLDLIHSLRPVTFNWKADNQGDLGLVAEEVASVEPLLVTRNDKGEVEGVKYDRISVVLINAIDQQQDEINSLKQQITELKGLICAGNKRNAICK